MEDVKRGPGRPPVDKTRKIRHVRFHVAVQAGGAVLSSMDSEKHKINLSKCPMELWPMGVHYIYSDMKKDYELVIPFGNIHYIELAGD